MRSLLCVCALLAAFASGAEYETFWGPRNPHRKCYGPVGYQPCRVAHSGQRWHFDIVSKTCIKTGACAENHNNFLTKEECEYACPSYSFCLFPVKEGPCTNTTPIAQWYFDRITHQCKKSNRCVFEENAFQSRQACVSMCRAVDVCNAPRPSELCESGQRTVWYFDPSSRTCRSDVNCHNRGNNFPSIHECHKVCVRRVVAPLTIRPVCLTHPPVHGCGPVGERWVYNVHAKRCERGFACAVAGNSFQTRSDCEHTCPTEAFCYLPRPHEDPSCAYHGPAKHTWFYDRFTKECRLGVTCAHASGNTFPSRELCSDICRSRDVCTQPPLFSSSCGEKQITVWHYSRKSRKCVKATNCHTRGNNFPSAHECHKVCDRRRNKQDCLHWPNRGPCYAFAFKWYYDHYHKDCFQFLYGGCNGGPNLFDSKEECKEVCIRSENTTSYGCNTPPTMEGCPIILRKYSFISESRRCDENFVCSGHPNGFRTQQECEQACLTGAPVPPKPPKRDCLYWLLNGNGCFQYMFTYYPDRSGRNHKVMMYTGCGHWRKRLYVFYIYYRQCMEIQWPAAART